MDNLTHTLTAAAISQAGLNRRTRFATLAIFIGANLPDVDWVTRFGGSATYLKYHRGITHSLLGVTVLAVVLAGVIYALGRRGAPKSTSPPLNGRWLFASCWIATASHALVDFTNAYGSRPFLPFSGRWYAWDIMFIVDPLVTGLVVAGLGFPWLLRLVSEEVGARRPGYQRGAIFSLCSILVLWGLRDLAHRRALSLVDSHTYSREVPRQVGVYPVPVNPFVWTAVVETDSAFHLFSVGALDSDVDTDSARVFHKIESSPALERAMATRTARIFSDFAKFLWAQVESDENGYVVTVRDLRFASPDGRRPGFVAEIELDPDLRVRSESFSFSGRVARGGS